MCDPEAVGKMIQVRNVRPEVHAELVRRAKLRGKTLTAYVEEILEREVATEPIEDVMARIKSRRPVRSKGFEAVNAVREAREEMEAKWERSWPTPRRSSES